MARELPSILPAQLDCLAASNQTEPGRNPADGFDNMGVGRRMKKQGPPEPLSEEHFANLKRKKGLPVDDPPAEEAPSTKKRRTSRSEKARKRGREKSSENGATLRVAAKQANGTKKAPGAPENAQKSAKVKPKKAPEPEPSSDEEMDDEFGASDLDDASGSELDEGEEQKLGDDFLGSDDSVYDSEQEGAKKEKFVFSEDEEDEEDREEKLTAANIEGLSRKLDEQLAREAAENEAELRESALQTNIDGDKPRILGAEDEEDELLAQTKGLLAPDLQMLRTRITETIRVLEDFANLAEEGRSRAEYTSQLLKDICACTCSAGCSPVCHVRAVTNKLVLRLWLQRIPGGKAHVSIPNSGRDDMGASLAGHTPFWHMPGYLRLLGICFRREKHLLSSKPTRCVFRVARIQRIWTARHSSIV